MVKFATWTTDFDSLTSALLNVFNSTVASIHSAMAFPSMGKSNLVLSVSCPVVLHSF